MKKIQIPFTANTDHGTGLGKAHSVDKTIKAWKMNFDAIMLG